MKAYRPEIDGLRTIAVIPVIFFHAGFSLFSGGYIGVDVFFVISGYLITQILYNDITKNTFSLLNFYERRARRIIPALFFVCLFSSIPAWYLMRPDELKSFGESLIGVSVFSSNISFWWNQGYFEENSKLLPLLHTWSLGVEEQFYIFFPILLLFLVKKFDHFTNLTIGLLIAISAAFSIWSINFQSHPKIDSGAFFLLPARAWELGIGALIAIAHANKALYLPSKKTIEALSLLGIALILIPMLTYEEGIAFPGVASIPPVIGAALVVAFANKETFTGKFLSLKFMVGIGLISYSLYLWHNPIFAFVRLYANTTDLPYDLISLTILVTLITAYLSWRYIEQPFRGKIVISKNTVFTCILFTSALLAALGSASIHATKSHEVNLANTLRHSNYVYFTNMDERKFMEARLTTDLPTVNSIAVGSSRMMQINTSTINEPFFNFAVSGATIEDLIAITPEAVTKLQPKTVYLGADPWGLNKFNGEKRWHSSKLYNYWMPLINETEPPSPKPRNNLATTERNGIFNTLYLSVNMGKYTAKTSEAESVAKKAFDGSHIYNESYVSKSEKEIRWNFTRNFLYKFKKFEYDRKGEQNYRNLITWLTKRGIEVKLFLTPYHPGLYEMFSQQGHPIIDIEKKFTKMASELGVQIIGSYNPETTECLSTEFYDGMHPKRSCIRRIIDRTKNKQYNSNEKKK